MFLDVADTAKALSHFSANGKTIVALDVFRATSTIVTALYRGARIILPVSSEEEAYALKKVHSNALLGGERYGERIEGFDLGNSPLEYREELIKDSQIIFLSTNGTKAILAAQDAEKVYLGSFLNALATVQQIRGEESVILACAGTKGTFSLEDTCCAGYILHLLRKIAKPELSDSAQAALALYEKYQEHLFTHLSQSRNGKALISKGREADIRYCCTKNILPLVPEFIPLEGILPFPFEERSNCTL